MSFDLLVREARVPGASEPTAIGVEDGRIAAIDPDLTDGERIVDADGALVAGGFVDCHVHLDKALTRGSIPPNESGTLEEAIANTHERKADYTVEEVRERARETIEMHVANGCTRLRSHVDVDTIGELTPLEGVLRAREDCAEIAQLQVVAFPQEGIVRDPGTAGLLAEAMDRGADAVGGMPDNERTDRDSRTHVDRCLDLASDHDAPIDMHVDESDDPNARSLETLAARVIEAGFDRGVTAGHTCALAAYDESHARRVIGLVEEAGIDVVTNPPTNLLIQGADDRHPKRRGITRVDQLRAAGVTVAAGQDCIRDPFYPYGRASMLETALLTAHAARLTTPEERAFAWRTVTDNAAAVMDVDHGVAEGLPATLNVFDPGVTTRTEAMAAGAPPRVVVHEGRVVAGNESTSTIHRTE